MSTAGVADGGEVDVDSEVTGAGVTTDTVAAARATTNTGPFAAIHEDLDALDGVAVPERIAVLENVNRLIADELADLDGL